MAWQTPKTNWGQPGQTVPGVDDFNRIEGNIETLGRYDRAPGYGTATGENNKIISLSPAPSSYYEGMCFAFRNEVQNTGPVTINVNGLGARSIKKPNGNDLVSGNLKAGSVYTVRYNGTNFILQGSDAAGTATPEDVTAGKTFSNDDDTDLVGALPILGNRSTTLIINGPDTPHVVIPPGRIDQSTIVAQIDPSKASIIKLGETLGGVTGTYAPSVGIIKQQLYEGSIMNDTRYVNLYFPAGTTCYIAFIDYMALWAYDSGLPVLTSRYNAGSLSAPVWVSFEAAYEDRIRLRISSYEDRTCYYSFTVYLVGY